MWPFNLLFDDDDDDEKVMDPERVEEICEDAVIKSSYTVKKKKYDVFVKKTSPLSYFIDMMRRISSSVSSNVDRYEMDNDGGFVKADDDAQSSGEEDEQVTTVSLEEGTAKKARKRRSEGVPINIGDTETPKPIWHKVTLANSMVRAFMLYKVISGMDIFIVSKLDSWRKNNSDLNSLDELYNWCERASLFERSVQQTTLNMKTMDHLKTTISVISAMEATKTSNSDLSELKKASQALISMYNKQSTDSIVNSASRIK
jgi:hypothetical protein